MKAEQSIFRSTFWYSLPSFTKPVLIICLDWQITQNQSDKKTSQLLERSFLFHQTCLFLWSYALHTAPTFLCKESRQRYTKNLLVFGFPAEGGVPPSIPPAIHRTFVIDVGERDRLRLLRGQSPQGISKGNPLRYAFGSFSRKRKGTAGVGCVTPQAEPAPNFTFFIKNL